jgi:hypothetical protein
MKPFSYQSLTFFICLMVFSCPFAQTGSVADTLPYLVVTPAKPTALKDSVTLQIMLGTAVNSCFAPTFINCSFEIQESPLTIYPPLFTVKVHFTKVDPKNIACPEVYNPVDYGPLFKLGILKLGTYQVTDGTTNYGGFSVGEGITPLPGHTLKGKVYDDPYPSKRMSRPIPNVKVYLQSGPMPLKETLETAAFSAPSIFINDSTQTDSTGSFAFTKLSSGLYDLTCVHKEYRTITRRLQLLSDTLLNCTMVPIDAFAAVAGTVTVVEANDSRIMPLEGCTVAVSKGAYLPTVGTDTWINEVRSAITDKNGKYSIDSIPISANGELWYVHAFKGPQYSDYQKVALYNMRTDSVNFKFLLPYQNRDSVVIKGIVFCTATDKYSYRRDEGVKIRYSITNTTDQQVSFGPFSGGCEYDLSITVIPTVLTAQKKVIYRQSENMVCLAVVSTITVDPHQTVIKDFPNYYLPDLTSFAPTNNKIMLLVSAKLNGAKYDSTEVGVPIEIRLDPTAVAEKRSASGSSLASCALQNQRIALNLLKAQNVSVAVFSLDGKMRPQAAFSRNLAAGAHTLSLMGPHMTKGIYIVGVKGTDFEKKFTVVNVK